MKTTQLIDEENLVNQEGQQQITETPAIDTDVAGGFIDRVKNLPPAPTIAVQLLGLFREPDRDVDRIVELIRLEPSLTAEVLNRCNSAVFGRGESATDVFEAVSRLGFYEIYCLVLALVSARALAISRPGGGVDAGTLWRHSVTSAVAAGIIAQRTDEEAPVAFTAGLLHDSGKLIFAAAEPMAYSMMVAEVGTHGPALAERELEIFGVSHAVVGARLMARWGMPPSVAFGVWYHHGSPKSAGPAERMAAIINLANDVAHRVTEGLAHPPDLELTAADAIEILGMVPDDLPDLIQATQDGLQQVETMLNMTV